MSSSRHRSLARADNILDHVARRPTAPTLTEIAREIDAPLSSTQDLVRELCALGYLRPTGTRYSIGFRLQVLDLIADRSPSSAIDHTELTRLSTLIRVPLTLAALVGRDIFYLDHAGPKAPDRIQVVADRHHPRPTLRTAAGRLLLAMRDEPMRKRILADIGSEDPEAQAAFFPELPAIRHDRMARSDGLADPEIAAIAVATREPDVAILLTARRAPRRGRIPTLEAAARTLRTQL
ncbi:MAG: helix-turn-helix domain-containing protein [Rhodococcus sp. (in: high G+C Gram-positive bacteria)]|nr:helix-turn-helix domain-containing protein [Rhodococcus sp. (in: high G+C Gram-positive bacteria)]MDI6626324.1 helix-turn-helix domain-containing protein [Rhodococcus sp. (in: high G+C Gram-positive bacteria)]